MTLFCPEDCPYLDPWEEDQTKNKEDHWCLKFNKRVRHYSYHPYLVVLDECEIADMVLVESDGL